MNDNRRRWSGHVVGLLGTMLVLAMPVGATAEEPRFDGSTVRVATWGGSWRDTIHALIGKELERRGAKVEYVIGAPLDNVAKLIAARGQGAPFDIIEMDEPAKLLLLEGSFLEELDFAGIPNSAHLQASQRDRHTVATVYGEYGIVYNAKKFEELGIPKPERFTDLLNPKLAGKVSLPDINVGPAVNGIVGFASEAGGDESNIIPGLELIKKLNVGSFYKSSTALVTRFNSGDVLAAVWSAGWAYRIQQTGMPIGMTFPRVKGKRGLMQIISIGMPKGAQARPAALFFIDRYLDPDVQVALAKKTGVAPGRAEALKRFAADPDLSKVFVNPHEMYEIDWTKVDMKEWIAKWNRVVIR